MQKTTIAAIILLCCHYTVPADTSAKKIPIVYRDEYNITFFGIQKFHPFDTEKYGRIYRALIKNMRLDPDQFIKPEPISDDDLLKVHTRAYLDSLKNPGRIAAIAEMPLLQKLSAATLQKRLLLPMRYATGGTVLGASLAMQHGWAINLSGGYHHAKAESGSGFCYFADIPLAVRILRERNPGLRVLIVDLDAHQGNGIESILKDDPRIAILDIYNGDIYPHDEAVKKYIRYNVPVGSHMQDAAYLALVQKYMHQALDGFPADLIIYNAGTDILEGDALGRLNISAAGIIRRDEIVFRAALGRKVPILMVLSGGYTKKSAQIVARSIEQIITPLAGSFF